MSRDTFAPPDWPEFPRTFHYVADRSGRKGILEELADQVVVYRDRDVVADAILKYCWHQIAWVPGVTDIDWEGAVKCRNMWLGLVPPLESEPIALAEKSHQGLAFKRLPFDSPPDLPLGTPDHFEALLTRFSNPMAICAFIGSLFYPDADRQQYLYLHGEGGDSKGTLMRFLHLIFGDAAQALSMPGQAGDKFWNFALYGKRLGLFYDTDPSDFFRKAHFKSLTGGDPQWFEEKGRMGFTATPQIKFIVSSNFKPQITSSPADRRRIIYTFCRPVPLGEKQSHFEHVLMKEAPAIISACKAVYLDDCRGHGSIPCEIEDDIVYSDESKYLDIFDKYFVKDDKSDVYGSDVSEALKHCGLTVSSEVNRLKGTWERVLGVKISHTKRGCCYRGIRKKSGG